MLLFISPFLLSACLSGDGSDDASSPSVAAPDVSIASACADPLVIPYHATRQGGALTGAEKANLVMSATGRVPSGQGTACEGDASSETYGFSDGETRSVRFKPSLTPLSAKTRDDSVIAKTTVDLIRNGRCEQAWDYLTPLVAAGSTEAAGVLWGANWNAFSTEKPGGNNGLSVRGHTAFGVTGAGMDLSLAHASMPSGPNGVHTNIADIRERAGRYLNVQFEDFVSETECNFMALTPRCHALAVESGKVKPLDDFTAFLTEPHPEKTVICNRRP